MYDGLLHLHSILRWIILLLLLVVIVQALSKNTSLRKTSLWLLIFAHLTLVLGVSQWMIGDWGIKKIQEFGFGEVMKHGQYRFFAIEHFAGMLIGIILITIARGKSKKLNYKAAAWLYIIALIIILATIPWPFREGIGRPWFPGMK